MAIVNPSFETPSATAEPGSANGWTWTSTSLAGIAWARFNTAPGVSPWAACQESFAAGFSLLWAAECADEAARLATGPHPAADVGLVLRQQDDLSVWVLARVVPDAWVDITTGNEAALVDFSLGRVVAGLFNGASTEHSSQFEMFEIWDGLPYLDPITEQGQDALGVGWRNGWEAATTAGLATYALEWPGALETFSDGWGDPALALTGSAPNAALRGAPLAFPVTLPPNRAMLIAVQREADAIRVLEIPPGVYATAADLAAAIQAPWAAATSLAPCVLAWRAWQDGALSGIELGWTGTAGIASVTLATLPRLASHDARALLGLADVGPGAGAVALPRAYVGTSDLADDAATDVFLLDPWATVEFRTAFSARAGLFHEACGWEIASFNAYAPNATVWATELFELRGWFGSTAVYHYDSSTMTETSGVFVGGEAGGIVESFENPAANWPSYL